MVTTKFIKQTKSLSKESVKQNWVLLDAENIVLGRLASTVSKLLRGKYKVSYTPHIDCGDNVVIINAEKIKLTGKKFENKEYISHSGYPGGQKTKTAKQVFDKNPSNLVEKAVKCIFPKTKLGSSIFSNLKVYAGEIHKHTAQNPKLINLKEY